MKNTMHRNSSLGIFSLSALVFLLVFSLAVDLYAKNDEWLNVALTGKPRGGYDPHSVTESVTSSILQNNVFECLVRYGKKRLVLEPSLAESWEVEQAGRIWIFTLRDDVYFHDGSSLTSDDVVDSFEKNNFFKGRVEKIDYRRVRCVLPNKRAGFARSMSQLSYAISKTLPDGRIVGTGPFFISEWNPSDKIILKPSRYYTEGKPAIEGVTFHCSMNARDALSLMREGKIDVIDIIPPPLASEVKSEDGLVLSTLEGVNISFIYINTKRPPLGELEFRRALNMAINREEIIRDIYFGHAISCRGLLPPAIGGKEEGPPKVTYDPSEARNIIKRYMKQENRIFKIAGLPYSRPYCPEPNALAGLIAGYLREVGLKVEYDQPEVWLSREERDEYDLSIAGWVLDSLNPDDFYTNIFGIGGVDTYPRILWMNEVFEKLLLQARETVSVRKQRELYHRADDVFFEDLPWVMIVHTNQLYAYREGISGLLFSPTGELRLSEVRKDTDM